MKFGISEILSPLLFTFLLLNIEAFGQNKINGQGDLFLLQEDTQARCANFENPNGEKSSGGKENKSAKGHAFEVIKPGGKKTLCNIKGNGIINHIWITLADRAPQTLRALKIEMYWDDCKTPAVQAPFGDFFCDILGKTSAFENELFSNPEGKSFNCYIKMPFKKSAKIVVTNETDSISSNFFYDIDFSYTKPHEENVLYFHAYWNRDTATKPGEDFAILPKVNGKGRFLGAHIGVIANPLYKDLWWGEGEAKMYIDGDKEYPTLIGTGAEDYPGTGWGLGVFNNRYQGCLIADSKTGYYSFYRYHIPDPIFFYKDFRATMQQMGGGRNKDVISSIDNGARIQPVTVGNRFGMLIKLLEMKNTPNIKDKDFPEGWVNFYRSDDWSSVAFFYLDSPDDGLPKMADAKQRTFNIK
jgi:hypothetical protein